MRKEVDNLIEIRSTENRDDIKHVGLAGGELHYKPNGTLVFRFPSYDQYRKFKDLQFQIQAK